jgi:hypothetical protein
MSAIVRFIGLHLMAGRRGWHQVGFTPFPSNARLFFGLRGGSRRGSEGNTGCSGCTRLVLQVKKKKKIRFSIHKILLFD